MTIYEQIGGHEAFTKLIDEFYARVAADQLLRPMYPEEDLTGAKDRLRMFLEQYWGGPHTYSQLRGHPRLRMRHVPFPVTPAARDQWLAHMRAAQDTLSLPPELDEQLWTYFVTAAHSMVNKLDDPDELAENNQVWQRSGPMDLGGPERR